MAMRDAAPLLSLLGHELRAPAGVIGGYLTMIERALDRLSPEQQQALAGARRAQHRLVEILDDASRLVATWKAEDHAAAGVPLTALLEDVRTMAAAQGLALSVDARHEPSAPIAGPRAALVEALVSVAAAVAREHGAAVTVSLSSGEAGAVICHVRADTTADGPIGEALTREPFNLWRSGLGLRLVVAATVLTDAGTALHEVLANGRRAGVDITFAAPAI